MGFKNSKHESLLTPEEKQTRRKKHPVSTAPARYPTGIPIIPEPGWKEPGNKSGAIPSRNTGSGGNKV